MALTRGTRLGPYEITDAVGAGGMGEVYRARDTRLDRTVAVKVLPADFAADADRRQRFEREARVIASLSHPNICALHDIGVVPSAPPDGTALSYLVMEYLDGETLADRLSRGALPRGEVIRVGSEIATALHAAHRQHIVHRDLKPGNVMLTRAGVKLLDFGLAKATAPMFSGGGSLTTHPISDVTVHGAVVGTLPYMSPEQVEGRPLDGRSDIFALGAVLYEMATGRRAFGDGSAAAVVSAILSAQPSPIASSPPLDRIVRTCLDKDPERRWQSAHDVALQLAALADADGTVPPRDARRRIPLAWGSAAAATIVALAALVWSASRGADLPASIGHDGPVEFALPPPPGGGFNHSVENISFAVSPDGTSIAYAARAADGRPRVWVRSLRSLEARPLPGTEDASSVFWRPDGKALGFFAAGQLKRIAVDGGTPFTICDTPEGIGLTGTWGADGRILFASVTGEALHSVQASGGSRTETRRPDPEKGELRIVWPSFLSDGRRYLYLVARDDDGGSIMLAGPEGEPREVLRARSTVQYLDAGYLLFVSDSTLVARRFDPASGTLSGDAIPIADPISYFRATGVAHFSASANGVIVYQPHRDEARLAAFDRAGREVSQVRPPGPYQSLRLSRDGRRLLFERADPRLTTFDAYMIDLARGAEMKLTTAPTTEAFPMWASDDTIVFTRVLGGRPHAARRHIVSGVEEPLTGEPGAQWAMDVSPDGEWLLVGHRDGVRPIEILALRLSSREVVSFRVAAAGETDARFSPDGKYVAYSATGTGRAEIVIQAFPSGASTPVSMAGGRLPRWSADGRELFYVASDGALMAVPVRLKPGLDIGQPARLFAARAADGGWWHYDVAPDGRFYAVVRTQIGVQQPLTVIVNWPTSLR